MFIVKIDFCYFILLNFIFLFVFDNLGLVMNWVFKYKIINLVLICIKINKYRYRKSIVYVFILL